MSAAAGVGSGSMTLEEHRGLGLLLVVSSSGCLGLPRYTDDGAGDDEGDGTTTQAIDEGPSPDGPEGPSPEGPEGPSPTTVDDDAGESFLFMPDVGPITSPTTAETSDVTTDPPPPDACQAYSAFITECYGPRNGESSFYYCTQYLEYLGGYTPECVPLFEEFLVCISELSCGDLNESGFCSDEVAKFEECQEG